MSVHAAEPPGARQLANDSWARASRKWWLPDDVVFLDRLPHTATGKLLKARLRDEFSDHLLKPTEPATDH